MRMWIRFCGFAFLVAIVGCDHHHHHGEGHDGPAEHDHHGGTREHGHDHHDQDRASEVLTRWGDRIQLFVEFPALVVGLGSPFAAHLTRIADHFALDSGRVVIQLTGGSQPDEEFAVNGPAVPGIFRPIVKPMHPGKRSIKLTLQYEDITEIYELGVFTVFTSKEEAVALSAKDDSSGDEIDYLLEQQWQVAFKTAQVTERELRPHIVVFADLLQPASTESRITAPRDGRVLASDIHFPRVGEMFEEGAILFRLTTPPIAGGDPATLDLAVEQAGIQVASARREVERLVPLVAQGVISQRRLDNAKSASATAEAELRSARRRRVNLAEAQGLGGEQDGLGVPTPLAGVVAELHVSPGTWVSEGDLLARVVDRDRLLLNVRVPEDYVGKLKSVSGAWFKLKDSARIVEVSRDALVSIGTELDPVTRTLPVRFLLNNERRDLYAGIFTQAHLIIDRPQLKTVVQRGAVIDDSGVDVIYVQTGGETFERRPVKLGIQDGDYVEVLSGVEAGEWVVETGGYFLKMASSSTDEIGHGHAH